MKLLLRFAIALACCSPTLALEQQTSGGRPNLLTNPSFEDGQTGWEFSSWNKRGSVSVDTTDSHKEFCAKESLTFKLLADTEKKVVDQYGSLGGNGVASRNTFLIDPSGKIVKVWTKVSPSKHSEEVLAALATSGK